jgi:hypothetical protein
MYQERNDPANGYGGSLPKKTFFWKRISDILLKAVAHRMEEDVTQVGFAAYIAGRP